MQKSRTNKHSARSYVSLVKSDYILPAVDDIDDSLILTGIKIVLSSFICVSLAVSFKVNR